jgi:hypothetical protein
MATRKDSSSSSDSDLAEYGVINPHLPGGSGTGAIAAPVAPVVHMPPIVQFDQKKVPTFWFEEGKDGLSIAEWIKRVDGMRIAMAWTDAATYHNAKNALFGAAATIMNTQCNKTVNADFAETWTWLKKRLRKQFGDCTSSREYVDIIFRMKPQTDLKVNPVVTASHIYGEFDKIKDAIPDNAFDVAADAGAPVARDEVKRLLDEEKVRICDAFAFAFMVNLLPGPVRTKVLDKDPQTIAETVDHIKDAYRSVIDEKRPLGMPAALQANITELSNVNGDMSRMELMITNMMNNRFKQYESKNNFQKKKKNQGNQNKQNNAGGNTQTVVKQCTYCQKKGHGQVGCWKRKADKAPCINGNGEPYYPKEDEAKTNVGATPPPQPTTGQSQGGSDFPGWV